MTIAKQDKGKSQAHCYSASTYRNQKHVPGMPMLEIRDLFVRVGIVGIVRRDNSQGQDHG